MNRTAIIVFGLLLTACQGPGARTAEEEANIAIVEKYVVAYNAKEDGWFDRFYSESIVSEGFLAFPGRMTTRYDDLKKFSNSVEPLFADSEITIENLYVDGDTVTMESVWRGTAEPGHPVLEAGHRQVTAQLATYKIRDGKFVEIHEYGLQTGIGR